MFSLTFSSLSMYLDSANSSIFFFGVDFTSSLSKNSVMMLSSNVVHHILHVCYHTHHIFCVVKLSLHVNLWFLSKLVKSRSNINVLDSKPSTSPTAGVSPLKYLCAVCSCISSVLPWIWFNIMFTEFFPLSSSHLSGVGVVPLSYLLVPAVSPEPLIFISCLYLFDLLILV